MGTVDQRSASEYSQRGMALFVKSQESTWEFSGV